MLEPVALAAVGAGPSWGDFAQPKSPKPSSSSGGSSDPCLSFRFSPYCLPFTAFRYTITIVIRSFRSPDTERLFRRESVRRFKAFERQVLRKLDMLDAAPDLRTLATLPGNRLEPLKGDRNGQYSIRINDQWRICFVWSEGHAHNVEIVDYH
jgi:toxin HigB-1